MNFLKNSHFALFSSFNIHAKYTMFINGMSCTHTCTQRHTQTDTITIFTFYTFWLIWHTCQRHKFYIWHTTDLHMHRHSDMHTHRHTDVQRYWHTDTDIDTHRHMHVCIHIQTHTHWFACGKSKEIVSSNPLLSQNGPKLLLWTWNLRKLLLESHFKLQLAKIVTLNGKSKEIITWNTF